jgi:hypothetical protein
LTELWVLATHWHSDAFYVLSLSILMDLTLVGCPPLSLFAFHSLEALPADTVSSWTTKQKKYVLEAFYRLNYLTGGQKAPRLFLFWMVEI